MGDDRPVVFICEMPSFISSIEEGKVKLSRHLPAETNVTEVERSVTDLLPNVTRANSPITLNGKEESERQIRWEEEQSSAAEEKDSDGDSAAEILNRNCGTISESTFLNVNNNSRVEYDRENDEDNANNGPIAERHIECGDCEKSNRETGEEVMKSEQSFRKTSGLTTPDVCKVDILTDRDKCYYNRECVSSKPTLENAEHVYCTVYCIANDSRRNAVEISEGYIETAPIESEAPTMETRRETESTPEPYSLSDLVDPRVMSPRSGDPGGVVVVLNCRVCLDDKVIAPLHCCQNAVCDECLKRYISSEILMGKAHIPCPTLECSGFLEEGLVVSYLAKEDVAKYHYLVELSQMDVNNKTCPKCSLFTTLKTLTPLRAEHKYKIQCSECQFVWCFKCHAPWHNGLKCREYRKGDKLFRSWANDVAYGQRNAQKCPQCKIHIQRTEGCDHMTCTQCNTNFCYRCGERYRHLRFFGDHTSNLSVFGCRFRYLPDKPHLRRLVRGSVCVGKMVIAPVAIVLLLVLGALSLVIGLVALPVYYVCKKKKKQLPYWYW